MLVLSRKKREAIHVASQITIHVVELKGDKVRIGIEAPLGLAVHRAEVRLAIERSEAADPRAKVNRIQAEINAMGLILDQLHEDYRAAIAVMVEHEHAAADINAA